MNTAVTAAISGIKESAWTPIRYPNAIWDEDEQRFISDAEVAETPFTAFTAFTAFTLGAKPSTCRPG